MRNSVLFSLVDHFYRGLLMPQTADSPAKFIFKRQIENYNILGNLHRTGESYSGFLLLGRKRV